MHQLNVATTAEDGDMVSEMLRVVPRFQYHLTAVCLSLIAVGGCAESRLPHASADMVSKPVVLPMGPIPDQSAKYVLVPGDVVEIKFFYHSQLNERTPIRPDGRIALQLVDDIQASGLTPMQLDKALTEAYARHIKDPELSVLVKEFSQRQVYVGGEVHNPGLVRSPESISALRAIFQSGGFKDTGNLESVVILRYNGTPTPEFMIVNLKSALKHGVEQQDIWLQSYDVVYVPKTYIASANQFMSEYIDKMIPIQRSIGLFWNFIPGSGSTIVGR